MTNTRQGSHLSAHKTKTIRRGNRLSAAVLLITTLGLLASRVDPVWSDPGAAIAPAPQLEQMKQTLERNRSELDKLREKLVWAQELLQHAGETLYLARTQHQQTLAVQHSLEQRFAAVHAQTVRDQADHRRAAALAEDNNARLLQRYRSQIQELQLERDQLRQTLQSRDQQLSQLQNELQAIHSSRQRAEQDSATIRDDLSNVRARYRICQNQWGEFSSKLDDLNLSVAAAQQSLATTMHTRNLLQDRLSACNDNLSQVRASFASMESTAIRPAPVDTSPTDFQRQPDSEPAIEAAPVPLEEKSENFRSDHSSAPCNTVSSAADECRPGVDISLHGVRFRYDSAELEDESRAILDRAARVLTRQPELVHEVAGHTDNQGNAAYNQWLSLQRANTVRNYLIERGVDGRRLVARGYGGSRPVADNSTWNGLVTNRRVELHVLRPLQNSASNEAGSYQGRL
jgi:outer membrane protein OmpA-like peptidoglycan-associated protein